MEDLAQRVVEGVVERLTGPMSLRFFVQPAVALILGWRDGRLDAKAGSRPFVFALISKPQHRKAALRSALATLITPIAVGTIMDAIAQYLIFERILLSVALLVGTFVMGVPYALSRGVTTRITRLARARRSRAQKPQAADSGRD